MRIETEVKLDYKDVLFRPKRSTLCSRNEVILDREFRFKHNDLIWSGIPIASANMDSTGTFEIANVLSKYKMLTCLHKHYSLEDYNKNVNINNADYIAISTGTSTGDFDKLFKVLNAWPSIRFICVDVANGYSESLVEFIKKVRGQFPSKIIIAGNVVSSEMTEELILSGADIVKVGIGGGSVCTTRIQTGVGYPQLSAVIECADAAHGLGGHIMADGGCICAGDVAKAFGGGADFAMVGGMFSGHDESGGKIEEVDGEKYKFFYGMSSETAMDKYNGGVASYRSSEGKTVRVKYKGQIDNTIKSILGGIRSTCAYIGARNTKDIPKCTTFIRVSQQSNEVFGVNN